MEEYIDFIVIASKISSIQTLKDQMKRKGQDLRMFRSKIVSVMGNYYLKEMKGEELKRAWHKAFVEVPQDIHSEKEIAEYVSDNVVKDKISRNDVQFRIYFVKDYSESESCLIFKVSHALSDGMSCLNIAANL